MRFIHYMPFKLVFIFFYFLKIAEVLQLRQDVEEKKQQVMVIQGESVIHQNGKKRAEDRISELEAALADQKSEILRARVRRYT